MKDIDKWFAEQCGVDQRSGAWWIINRTTGKVIYQGVCDFIIDKPDCREAIRERFSIDTVTYKSLGESAWLSNDNGENEGSGKTPAEAEIACCEAIYEARNGN